MRSIILALYVLSLVAIVIGIAGLTKWPITLIAAAVATLTFIGWDKVRLALRLGIFNDGGTGK